ncbi:G-protein coupled receptor moody-like [Acanthaster planci]|uniref:G-protein coupled receptor moody-like n=1 Tax=Acanthaster planci TaxID=133434 RepID=A0A8B7XKM4_ACAPL|nr:G-protein coupled receptor moody-like [Acanthaster planci]
MSNYTQTVGVVSTTSVYTSYIERQFLAAIYGLISFAGVLGNCAVLLAVVLSRRPRTVTNVFVVNLAVADLITCLSMPISILAALSESREELLVSRNLCAFQGFVLIVCIGCSLNNIAAIAVYRALITRRQNSSRLRALFSRRGLAVMVSTSWLIPFAVGLLPIVSEFGSYEYDFKLSTCTFNPTANGSSTFSKIMVALYYPVQLLTTFASYAVILYTVRRHRRRITAATERRVAVVGSATMKLPPSPNTPGPSHKPAWQGLSANDRLRVAPAHGPLRQRSRPGSFPAIRPSSRAAVGPPAQGRRHIHRQIKVNLSLFLVVFFFLLCFTPYSVLMALLRNKSLKVFPFLGALVTFNSCVNPVIYAARHPDFKTVIRSILLCRPSQIPMKSSFLQSLLSLRRQ